MMKLDGRRLLIISSYYAPNSLVGAYRFSFLTREFERLGANVDVVTMPLGGEPADLSLPRSGTVHEVRPWVRYDSDPRGPLRRIQSRLMERTLAAVDPNVGWYFPARRRCRDLVRHATFDLIIATVPIYTSAYVASSLSRSFGVPFIIDYRDPWTGFAWPGHSDASTWRQRLSRFLESSCLKNAIARVFVTQSMREQFEKHFAHLAASDNYVLTNGYDLVPERPVTPLSGNHVTIVHAGYLYGDRYIVHFLRAISELNADRKHSHSQIRVHSFGHSDTEDINQVRREGMGNLLEFHPQVPREEMLSILSRADLLLVVSGNQMSYSIPYKTFDYLAVGKPILALAPKGSELENFSTSIQCMEFADITDQDAVKRALLSLLNRERRLLKESRDAFNWRQIATEYSEIIGKYCAN